MVFEGPSELDRYQILAYADTKNKKTCRNRFITRIGIMMCKECNKNPDFKILKRKSFKNNITFITFICNNIFCA